MLLLRRQGYNWLVDQIRGKSLPHSQVQAKVQGKYQYYSIGSVAGDPALGVASRTLTIFGPAAEGSRSP
jgi:hypothetical protein